MDKIKFGIFGLGRGSGFYDGVSANNGEVVAVCDFDEKKLIDCAVGHEDFFVEKGHIEFVGICSKCRNNK